MPRRDLSTVPRVLPDPPGRGVAEQESVAVCSGPGSGTPPSLPPASTSRCGRSSLGLCPERHKGHLQREDTETLAVPGRLSHAGTSLPGKALPNPPAGAGCVG